MMEKIYKFDNYLYWRIQCAMLILYVPMLLNSISFSNLNLNSSINMLIQETREWGLSYIVDIQSAQPDECPEDYEQVKFQFLGTTHWCELNENGTEYFIGDCTLSNQKILGKYKPVGRDVAGLDQQELVAIANQSLCVKRSEYSYHNLMDFRTEQACSSSELECGSTDYTLEQSFCIDASDSCPLNYLNFTNDTDYTENLTEFGNGWYYNYSINSDNNPFVTPYISLSQPCGDLSQGYYKRLYNISEYYVEGNCSFYLSGTILHPNYIPLNFFSSEYDVYLDNNLLTDISKKAPNYTEEVLLLNYYQIYAKPYALWKTVCQQTYTTEYIANSTQLLSNINVTLEGLLGFAWYHFLFVLISSLQVIYTFNIKWKQNAFLKYSTLVFAIIYVILIISELLYLLPAYRNITGLDQEQLNFIIENQCSDDIVNLSFQYLFDQTNDVTSKFNFILIIVIVIIVLQTILSFIYLLSLNLCQKKKKSNEEFLLENIQTDVRQQTELRVNTLEDAKHFQFEKEETQLQFDKEDEDDDESYSYKSKDD